MSKIWLIGGLVEAAWMDHISDFGLLELSVFWIAVTIFAIAYKYIFEQPKKQEANEQK